MVSGGKIHEAGTHCFSKASTSGYFPLIRNLAALISFTLVFSGSIALSTQSVEAKASRDSSRRARNYFVPPPPPYTPSMVPSTLGMTNAQAVTADEDDAVLEKPVNPYSKYFFTRKQGDVPRNVQLNPSVSSNPGAETRILKEIDYFDAEISSHQKEIDRLLNL